MENTSETVSATVRAAADVIADVLNIDSFADEVDAELAPLYPEVAHAYAHFTAEIP
ncbi:hypothetical protein ACFO5K_04505 [Nocardia halotolerans]|uniref:Uncharacterized protein n=1 Tax=Nocardia halotolerans TaxID=1755878 RepID=A0ABV8VEU5_9NOCA